MRSSCRSSFATHSQSRWPRLVVAAVAAAALIAPMQAAGIVYGLHSCGSDPACAVAGDSKPPTLLFYFDDSATTLTEVADVTLFGGGPSNTDAMAYSLAHGLLAFDLENLPITGSRLVSIDPVTAVATPIGSTLASREMRGAAFAGPHLYVLDAAGDELVRVDPNSGSEISAVALSYLAAPFDASTLTDLAFAADGTLYLSDRDTLYTVDPATGDLTFVFEDLAIDATDPLMLTLATAGLALPPSQPDIAYVYEISGLEDVFSYDLANAFTRSKLLSGIGTRNAGRGDLATNVSLLVASPVDDFTIGPVTNPMVAPTLTPVVDTQVGLPATSVLGSERTITLTANSASAPQPAQFEQIGSAMRFTGGATGGSVELHYPLASPQDLTFGLPVPVPARVRVAATQVQAGASLTLTLEDQSAASASQSLVTSSYADPQPTYYDFYLDPDSLSGSPGALDFSAVDDFRVQLATNNNDVFDLVAVELESVPTESVAWASAVVVQPTGGGFEHPLMSIAFNPQPEPPAGPTDPLVDLSDPTTLSLTLPGQTASDFQLAIATLDPAGGPATPMRLDPSGELVGGTYQFRAANGSSYAVVVEFTSASGFPPDPIKWRAFNPMPEPPALPSDLIGFGFSFDPSGMIAFGGGGTDDVSVTLRIQAPDQSFLSFYQTNVPALPGLTPHAFAVVLCGACAAMLRVRARKRGGVAHST